MIRIAVRMFSVVLLTSVSLAQECDTLIFDSHGSKIVGYFYASNSPHSSTLLFTQGFMDTGDIWGIGKVLSRNGINLFTFDFRGCFRSGGKQGLMNSQQDIEAALSFLASPEMTFKYRIDATKIILGGYSYGGHMSMLYVVHHPEIRRVISISGGDLGILAKMARHDPDLREGYSKFFESIKKPKGPVVFAYELPIEELLENQALFSILDQCDKLSQTDILMTGGLDDQVVSMEDFLLPIYRRLKTNKNQRLQFLVYQTNHSYKNVSATLIKDIVSWIKKD